ncbi:hypothetical protein GSI_07327 [Ganoderma sinense ZZ0214-1]|uniref:Uncharacterized protein n=1 Tax=Ganoderma sinense ZZ0214-1 TaxID=1077348 RepID=A0A2G8SA35_9APHY|nr:hypothetical protein GSI_07327 [Ganoderma sinense ZZ0214-1]
MDPLLNIPRLSELSGHLQQLPTTDRGAFSTLTSIPDIQAWALAKADEYRRFSLALLAIHNLAAPIHRLPTEVLERVFSNCWQDWSSLRLPHVCRLWRSILLDRPEFWADAVAKCELEEKREIVRSELPLIHSLLSRSTQHSHTINPKFYIFPPAIVQVMAPYSSSIASLHVAVGRIDLRDGLWPALLSGMANLETLIIRIAMTEEDLDQARRMGHADLMRHSPAWSELPMLSRDALPKLSRLTCPHSMVGRFSDVPLRHLIAQVIVMKPFSQRSFEWYLPKVVLGRPQGLHLEPHRSRLETLEIMPTGIVEEDPYATPLEPLDLFSLRHLRIEGDKDVVSHILLWLQLPQAASVHIPSIYAYSDDLGTKLKSVVDTIDRACLQYLDRHSGMLHQYRMQCFVGGIDRLRIDGLCADSSTLISVFGENAPVAHLELSAKSSYLLMNNFDLHAFPHLVHLDVSVSNVHAMAVLLKPALHPYRRRLGDDDGLSVLKWGVPNSDDSTLPSLKLTELVISCPPPEFGWYMGRFDKDTDFGTRVDELFREQFGVFQQALSDRAACGTRLTYLVLSLRPAAPPEETYSTETSETEDEDPEETSEAGSDEGIKETSEAEDGELEGTSETESDEELEEASEAKDEGFEETSEAESDDSEEPELEAGARQQQQQVHPNEEAGYGGEPGNETGSSSSNEPAAHKGPEVKPYALWPSHTARRAALQSLRELVDGPVILKLLDDTGDEITVEEI